MPDVCHTWFRCSKKDRNLKYMEWLRKKERKIEREVYFISFLFLDNRFKKLKKIINLEQNKEYVSVNKKKMKHLKNYLR